MDPEASKIATAVITTLTKDTVKSIFSYFPAKLSNIYNRYFKNFEEYLERTHKTCAFVRTIINKERPIAINDIYVKGKFKCEKEVVDDDELCQRIRDGVRVVVSGFGGIGKTIFCKYFWKSLYDNPIGKIPIYFELRTLNDLTSQSLEAYIRHSLTTETTSIPEAVFRDMMAAGRFIFIFDGFDEVPDKNRTEIESQLLRLANHYSSCGFLVSSRADGRFSSWVEFHNYSALSFDKEQSREVINNVDFDQDIKSEFLREILEKKYDDYKFFFSTPLLSLMMLMTYNQIKYIPDSRHVFYRYAFQTLYTLHDASKQGYQRTRYISMSESEFIHVFSLFCLVSYADNEHSFTKNEILTYLDKAKIRSAIDFDSEMFLRECTESVNLIYRDGDEYTFIHRSFQEYFCAYAATHYFPNKVDSVVSMLPVRHTDSVFSMMYLMNADVVLKMYIIPTYERQKSDINSTIRKTDVRDILGSIGMKMEVFFDSDIKIAHFGYSTAYNSDIRHFVEAMLCFFKGELPFEKSREYFKYNQIVKLISGTVRIFKIKKTKNARHFQATFDFAESVIILREFAIKSTDEEREHGRLNMFEQDELSCGDCFSEISQSFKSELVFAKRKCDELVRKQKDIIRRGDGILSL